MKAAFDEIMATAVKRQHEPQRIVGDLLKAEINEKQARSIKYPGESGEHFYRVIRLARKSSSHPAVFRLRRKEAFPGARRTRFCAMCLIVQKLAGA
jgi:hypothetical protein